METITIILGIVFFVFGVLQIILFFKLWRMADDVSIISKKMSDLNACFLQKINSSNNLGRDLSELDNKITHVAINPIRPKFEVGAIVLDRNTMNKLVVMEIGISGYLCGNEAGEIDRIYDFDEVIELPEAQ